MQIYAYAETKPVVRNICKKKGNAIALVYDTNHNTWHPIEKE